MKRVLIPLFVFSLCQVAAAEAPDTLWTRVSGGLGDELGYWVQEASDSGFVVVGYTSSFGAGGWDYYFVKYNPGGSVAWSGPHGGSDRDDGLVICSAPDGGYLVAGFSASYAPNGFDYHLVKLNAGGGEIWDQDYGIINLADYLVAMCRTVDDHYVMVGTRVPDTTDMYIVKVNSAGGLQWEHNMDLPGTPSPNGVAATSDSGFAVVGEAGTKLYAARHSKFGGVVWGRSYGGAAGGRAIAQTADGGFIVLGTKSFTGKDDDFWLLRLDADGDSLWSRNYGNADPDKAWSLDITHDGGFVLAGQHYPPGQNLNMWVVRVDALGDTLWTKSIGKDGSEWANCVRQLSDSSYAVVGRTNSFGAGNDVYAARIAPDPPVATAVQDPHPVTPAEHELGPNYPNPFNAGTQIEYTLAGTDRVRIVVYNALGQVVCTLRDRAAQAGTHFANWDGRNSAGGEVASGVYFYRLESRSLTRVRRMLLLR